jgi:hypothetical protein
MAVNVRSQRHDSRHGVFLEERGAVHSCVQRRLQNFTLGRNQNTENINRYCSYSPEDQPAKEGFNPLATCAAEAESSQHDDDTEAYGDQPPR